MVLEELQTYPESNFWLEPELWPALDRLAFPIFL